MYLKAQLPCRSYSDNIKVCKQKSCFTAGEEKTVRWKALKVGNFVKVHDDELFPADIVCLKAGLHDNVCFIRTSNLDGESNLKIRKPVDLRLVPGLEESMKSTEDMVELDSPILSHVTFIFTMLTCCLPDRV